MLKTLATLAALLLVAPAHAGNFSESEKTGMAGLAMGICLGAFQNSVLEKVLSETAKLNFCTCKAKIVSEALTPQMVAEGNQAVLDKLAANADEMCLRTMY